MLATQPKPLSGRVVVEPRRPSLLTCAFALAVCAVSVAGFAGRLHWTLDLASHFRAQYALALLLLLVALWWRGAGRLLLGICLLCWAVQLGTLVPLFWPQPAAAPAAQSFRVLLSNVHTRNREFDRVRALLASESPDVVVLQETDRAWLDALRADAERWPHRIEEPRSDNFGIAVWSRWPLLEARFADFGGTGLPTVLATLDHPAGRIQFVAVHPLPPAGATRTRLRNAALVALAEHCRIQTEPVLVLGDLNCTPWSVRFRDLLRDGHLRDSSLGMGWQPTWPTKLWWFGIPIDHCLHSTGLRVQRRWLTDHVGSDHRPLVVDVGVR